MSGERRDESRRCSVPEIHGKVGYDLASGWGTPNIANIVSDLASK
jgi:hypothetical protein